MAIDQVDRTVTTTQQPVVATTQQPVVTAGETVRTDSRRTTTSGPGGAEMARRIVVLVFGLIQIVIGARIVLLLLLDAREANALVSAILTVSEVLVAPFEGILRTDSLNAAGSVLDVTALVALVGWTILELVVLWVISVFRRRSATAAI